MYYQTEDESELPYSVVMKWIAALTGVFALFLILDFIMPSTCNSQIVQEKTFFKESSRFGSTNYDLEVITQDFSFKAQPELFSAIEENSTIEVCRTLIFSNVRKVSGISGLNNQPFAMEVILPVYRGYGAFPICLLIVSAFGFFFKKDDTVAYGASIISIVLMITMLMILK